MDSQFVNFDGRSVHDVLKLLLAASGDPEAIARLMQEIQTVDAKFGPVNTELARLEEDKQDAGEYAVVDDNWFTSAKFISGGTGQNKEEQVQINLDNKDGETYQSQAINFGKSKITKYVRTLAGAWLIDSTYSADEDSGWLTLTSDYVDLYYRKQNGVLYLKLAQPAKQNLSGAIPNVFTLPETFRPRQPSYIFFDTANTSARIRFYIAANNGNIDLNAPAQIAQGTQLQGIYAIPI